MTLESWEGDVSRLITREGGGAGCKKVVLTVKVGEGNVSGTLRVIEGMLPGTRRMVEGVLPGT